MCGPWPDLMQARVILAAGDCVTTAAARPIVAPELRAALLRVEWVLADNEAVNTPEPTLMGASSR